MNDDAIALRARLVRNIDEAVLEHQRREPLYDTHAARLAIGTAAQRLGASIDIVAPGKRSSPYHAHHAQEELFVVLEGHGTLRVAGARVPIGKGDVIFIPPGPEYPHQIVNTSDAPLKYLSVSTRDAADVCEYPDSGKIAAIVRQADGTATQAVHRRADAVDYWDGEP